MKLIDLTGLSEFLKKCKEIFALTKDLPFIKGTGINSARQNGTEAVARGEGAVAFGASMANGYYSHAEGDNTNASGTCSHVEGAGAIASGNYSHAEGYTTDASGERSHAEGNGTVAKGSGSHAEGFDTEARGQYSHAEGRSTTAMGKYSHAEGYMTNAFGDSSHAEGQNTITTNTVEHAEGKYNKSNTNTRHSVGIGTSDNNRKNAFEIMQNGDAYLIGVGNYEGNNLKTDTTKPSKTLQTVISEAFTNANMSALEEDYGYIKNKVGGYYVEVPNDDITVNIGSTAFQGDEIEISWDTLQECGVPKSFKDLLIVDGRIMYCTVQDAFGEDWHSGKLYYNWDDDAIYLTILDTDYLDFETFDIHNQTDGELRNGTSIARVHIPRSYLKDVESSNNKIQSVSLTNPTTYKYPSEKAVADILKPAIIDGSVNSNNEFEPSPEFTRAEWDEIANDYKLGRTIILNADFNETQCHSTVISYYDDLSYMSVLIGTTIVVWKRPLN